MMHHTRFNVRFEVKKCVNVNTKQDSDYIRRSFGVIFLVVIEISIYRSRHYVYQVD